MKAEWRDVCEGHASGTSQQMLPSISLVLIRQGSLVSGSHSIYVAEKIIYVGSRVGLLGITWDERLVSGHCGRPFRPGDQLFSKGCRITLPVFLGISGTQATRC